jgi:hypothetical protein
MSRRTPRTTVTVAFVCVTGLLSLSGAGCGGGKGTRSPALPQSRSVSTDPAASSTTSTTMPPARTAASTSAINKVVWFAGFKLAVKAATLKTDPDAGTGAVDLAVTFNNQGSDPVRFDGQINLHWGGNTDKFDIATLPTVAPGASSDATLTFSVDDRFTFDGSLVTIGAPDHHQAVIPLGATGPFIDLAPVRIGVTGPVSAGSLKANVTSGELRADVERSHLELDRTQEALFVSLDINWSGNSNYALSRNNFALLLPTGSQVTADEAPIDVLNPGATRTNETVRFTVPEPTSGFYAFLLRDPTANRAPGELPFVIAINDLGAAAGAAASTTVPSAPPPAG